MNLSPICCLMYLIVSVPVPPRPIKIDTVFSFSSLRTADDIIPPPDLKDRFSIIAMMLYSASKKLLSARG